MDKEKFHLEYNFKTSPNILFKRLSTASGLNEWFAEEVEVNQKTFTFGWNGTFQKAIMTHKKKLKYVRFHWLEDQDPKTYFEFKINRHELTKEVALIITDFAKEIEIEDQKSLWNAQIKKLKRNLGL